MFTLGHGARRAAELVAILEAAEVGALVDVRAFPISRRNPQFSRDVLSVTLQEAGIRYEWHGQALGGYRRGAYREHMKTPAFREAVAGLAQRHESVCIMCAESNPDECHRAHIADWLVARGHRVVHLLAPGRAREHAINPQEDLWQED